MRLENLQSVAKYYTEKLQVLDFVKVGWKKDCPDPSRSKRTHCHTEGENRGLICVALPDLKDHRGVKWLIAHEVCHLKVQSHSSPYFNRYMALLGFKIEKRMAQRAGVLRHRHDWRWLTPIAPDSLCQECQICNAKREGKITWGKVKEG